MLLYKSFVSSADLGAKLITLDKVLTLAVWARSLEAPELYNKYSIWSSYDSLRWLLKSPVHFLPATRARSMRASISVIHLRLLLINSRIGPSQGAWTHKRMELSYGCHGWPSKHFNRWKRVWRNFPQATTRMLPSRNPSCSRLGLILKKHLTNWSRWCSSCQRSMHCSVRMQVPHYDSTSDHLDQTSVTLSSAATVLLSMCSLRLEVLTLSHISTSGNLVNHLFERSIRCQGVSELW